MNPTQLFDPASSTYTYILLDEASREAIIIDPVDEQLDRDLATLERLGARLKWALETHAHADHITSAARLAELTGARLAAPAGCEVGTAAVQLKEGDSVPFGREQLRVLHTPGHTAGSVCFYWQRAPHPRALHQRGRILARLDHAHVDRAPLGMQCVRRSGEDRVDLAQSLEVDRQSIGEKGVQHEP